MPRNPIEIAKRARPQSEEVRSIRQSEEFLSRTLPRKHTRLSMLLHSIYDIFQQRMDYLAANPEPSAAPGVASEEFRYLAENSLSRYSSATMSKAKKLMGISSLKVGNTWYWTFPKRAPDAALQRIHDKRMEELRDRGLALTTDAEGKVVFTSATRPVYFRLTEYMRRNGYEALNKKVLAELGNNKQVLHRAKSHLGIVSIKRDGAWYWVYPAQEVQDWLVSELSAGPVEARTLVGRALADRGWSADVVAYARHAAGGIKFVSIEGKLHWRLQ